MKQSASLSQSKLTFLSCLLLFLKTVTSPGLYATAYIDYKMHDKSVVINLLSVLFVLLHCCPHCHLEHYSEVY